MSKVMRLGSISIFFLQFPLLTVTALIVSTLLITSSGSLVYGQDSGISPPSSPSLSPSTTNFLTYDNRTFGIRLQYPADWERVEISNTVTFLPPTSPPAASQQGNNTIMEEQQQQQQELFREGLSITTQDISVLYGSNITLMDFVNNIISSLQQIAPDLQLTESTATTLARATGGEGGGSSSNNSTILPAHMVVFTWTNPQTGDSVKTMETYAIEDGKGYIITYGARLDRYDIFLPTIQGMISSLGIYDDANSDQRIDNNNNNADAALTPQASFFSYENLDVLGFQIQYPSDWEITEFEPGGVSFHTSSENLAENEVFPEQVGILWFGDLPLDISIDDVTAINEYLSSLPDNFVAEFPDYAVVAGPTQITLDGNPAQQMILRNRIEDKEYDVMEIWTTQNGRVFQIEISVQAGLYSAFPPAHIQHMLDSLDITY